MAEAVSFHQSTPPAGLRARKKAQIRALLVEAALQLFAEHGFAPVTVQQIADAAGVSRSSFFRYFDTKDAALFHTSRRALGAMLDDFHLRCGHGEPREALRGSLLTAAALFERQRDYFHMLHRLMAEDHSLRASSAEHSESLLAEVTAHYLLHTGSEDQIAARVQVAGMLAASAVAMDVWGRAQDGEGLHSLTVRALAALG